MIFARKYGTLLTGAFLISLPIVKRAAADYAVAADWTPVAGDVRVSIDFGAWANITNLPTADAAGGNGATALWNFILTAAELTGKQVRVAIADATAKVIEDQAFVVETFGHASAMYPADPTADTADIDSRYQRSVKGVTLVTVGVGSTATSVVTSSLSPAAAVADQFKDQLLCFAQDTTTANLRGVKMPITASTAGGVLTVSALPAAPVSGDTATIQ